MIWTAIKRTFRVKGDGVVHATWDEDEDQTEIHLERK